MKMDRRKKNRKIGRPKADEKTRRKPSENCRRINKRARGAGRERGRQNSEKSPNATGKASDAAKKERQERGYCQKNNKSLRLLLQYKSSKRETTTKLRALCCSTKHAINEDDKSERFLSSLQGNNER